MDAARWAVDSLRFSDTNWFIQDASDNPHLRGLAWSLVVNGYRCWASQPCSERELYSDLCEDAYVEQGHARTLILRGVTPDGGQTNVLGTVRLLISPLKSPASTLLPLEAMGMFGSMQRWEQFFAAECRASHAFELGRMGLAGSMTDERARARGLHHAVITLLIAGGIGFAGVCYDRQDCVVVASQRIQKALRAAAVEVHVYDGFDLMPTQNPILQRYARYWLADKPQLCRLSVSPAAVRAAAATLDQLFPQTLMVG